MHCLGEHLAAHRWATEDSSQEMAQSGVCSIASSFREQQFTPGNKLKYNPYSSAASQGPDHATKQLTSACPDLTLRSQPGCFVLRFPRGEQNSVATEVHESI